MEDRIRNILSTLEDAISYEEWEQVEEARRELLFVLEDLESDFLFQTEDF